MSSMQPQGSSQHRAVPTSPLVCVVDDDDLCREYLSHLLEKHGYRVLEASCGKELMAATEQHSVQCIILDYNLISENGLALQEHLKRTFAEVPPIVMLTAEHGERTIIKAFRCGVSDYVLKDGLKADELLTAVDRAIDRRAGEIAQKEEIARLRLGSEFDDESGLYARDHVEKLLARKAAGGGGSRYAVIMIALDDLDDIADKLGSVIRNRVVRAFCTRLRKASEANSVCGRYDGATFVYLMDVGVTCKTVTAVCSGLARELGLPLDFDALSLKPAPAIGAAIYPFDGDTAERVVQAAVQAMHAAKIAGMPFVIASTAAEPEQPPGDGAALPGARGEAPKPAAAMAVVGHQFDRRSEQRRKVFKRGQIHLPNLHSAIECTIRDISNSGARLRVEGRFVAPERFELVLSPKDGRKRVLLRWQNGNELGVQFEP